MENGNYNLGLRAHDLGVGLAFQARSLWVRSRAATVFARVLQRLLNILCR